MILFDEGDCRERLATIPDAFFDAIVTDPPYGLNFMGKEWDHGVPGVPFWREFLRVAKPGAHLVAFGGTRTWHRLAIAIEDAGWEIRDTLCWMYGQGFPKSLDVARAVDTHLVYGSSSQTQLRQRDMGTDYRPHPAAGSDGFGDGNLRKGADGDTMGKQRPVESDVARQWSGWGTALKPAFEPIILARKPLVGTVAANVLAHGVGGINIDACRIEVPDQKGGASYAGGSARVIGREHGEGVGFAQCAGDPNDGKGRWPANVVLDEEAAALLDEQTGTLTSGKVTKVYSATLQTSVALDAMQRDLHPGKVFSDSGGASRFFYVAKASRSERTHGGAVENKHPTVKPLALMRWLVRLVTPPGGLVLDPFVGSGTTAVTCVEEGFDCVGIEQDPVNTETARARVAEAEKQKARER